MRIGLHYWNGKYTDEMSLDEIKKYLEDRQGYGDFDDSDLIFRLVNEIQKLQTVLTKETEGLK